MFGHRNTGLRLDGARALVLHISEGRLGAALSRMELKKDFGERAHDAGGASAADGADGPPVTMSNCLGGKLKQQECLWGWG